MPADTMLARRIIPALEVTGGEMARGPGSSVAADPVELARFYHSAGADELLLLDRTLASLERAAQMEDLLTRLSREVFIPLIIGGDIEAPAQARSLLRAGADRVILDAAVLKKPDTIDRVSQLIGPERVVLGVLLRRRRGDASASESDGNSAGQSESALTSGSGYEVMKADGERSSGRDVLEWIEEGVSRGAGEVLIVEEPDVRAAGNGYDLDLLESIARVVDVPLMAFGGPSHPGHFVSAFSRAGVSGAVASAIFHARDTSIKRIKRDCAEAGLPIRPLPVEDELPSVDDAPVDLDVLGSDVPTPPGPSRPDERTEP